MAMSEGSTSGRAPSRAVSSSARRWSSCTAGAAYPDIALTLAARNIRAVSSRRSRSAESAVGSTSSMARESNRVASTCAPRPCSA